MKRNMLHTLAISLMVFCSGKVHAQGELLAFVSGSSPINFISRSDEKVKVSEITPNPASNIANVIVQSLNPIEMKLRVFTISGDLVKEGALELTPGSNALNIDMNELPKGVYVVQFYSKEGSALRKISTMD